MRNRRVIICSHTGGSIAPSTVLLGVSESDSPASNAGYPYAYANQFVASESGTLTSLGILLTQIGTQLKMALYADNGSNRPGALLGQTGNHTPSAIGWQTITLVSPVAITSGTKYWIMWVSQNNTDKVGYNSTGGLTAVYSAIVYGSAFPDPAGTADGTGAHKYFLNGRK